MRTILIIAVVLAVAFADAEACVREKCAKEVSACEKELFGCASKALGCSNKCNGDNACNAKCAESSGNAKLIALNTCGKRECFGVTSFNDVFSSECQVLGCIESFQSECLNAIDGMRALNCSLSFFETHPECECIKDY